MDTEKLKDALYEKIQNLIPRITSDHYHGHNQKRFYHFTSMENFAKIIESNAIYSTYFGHLNDPTEVHFPQQLLKKAIAEYPNFNWFHKEKLQNLGRENWMNDLYKKMGDGFLPYEQELGLYTCSFSKDADDFNCWRFYGNQGKGVSLGFEFNDNLQDLKIAEGPRIHLQEILYGQEEVERWVASVFQQVYNLHGQIKANDIVEIMISNFLFLLPSIKHQGYKIEKEVRLLRYQMRYKQNNLIVDALASHRFKDVDYDPKLPKDVHLQRIRPKNITSKYRLELDVSEHLKEIWVGPALDFKSAKKHIEKILHDNEILNVEIKESKHPIC